MALAGKYVDTWTNIRFEVQEDVYTLFIAFACLTHKIRVIDYKKYLPV